MIKLAFQEEGYTHRCSGLPASFKLLSSSFRFKVVISKIDNLISLSSCSRCRLLIRIRHKSYFIRYKMLHIAPLIVHKREGLWEC